MYKYKFSSSIIISFFTLFSDQINAMENDEEHRPSQNDMFPQVQQLDKDFYVGRMCSQAGKDLWLVMEQVSVNNYRTWSQYINVQCNPRAIEYASNVAEQIHKSPQKGTTSDGSCHFRRVLEEVSYDQNEIWVAYITKAEKLKKFNDGIIWYTVDDLDGSSKQYTSDIEMFVTVTSSPEALITSHMGVASSLEGLIGTRQKGTSIDLHSFAAKIMLMRNPNRRFMVNAPVFAMEKLVVDALPDSTFVGTRQMREKMQKVQGIGQREFVRLKGKEMKEKLHKKAIKEADSENRNLERSIRLLNDGKITGETEESLRQKAIGYLPSYSLVEMGPEGKFVISEAKIESQYQKELPEQFTWFKNPHYFAPAKSSQETAAVGFLKFMEEHPPILSVTGQGNQKVFTIFDPENPETPWLTVDKSCERNYNWIFQDPFLPAGLCHYMVVDLAALAQSKPLLDIDLKLYRNMGYPYSIEIKDEDYADPEGKFVQLLKNNSSVVDLTIHKEFNVWDNVCYQNYQNLILEGLQNKPHLRYFTIVGNFDTDLFFDSSRICIGNNNISPSDFLKRPHLQFFTNLQELHVTKYIMGANRNDAFVKISFIPHLRKVHKLKMFTHNDF